MRRYWVAAMVWSVVCGLGLAPALGQAGQPNAAAGPTALELRAAEERPVITFTRGPAQLLLRPEERVLYDSLESNSKRAEFIEKFFATMARNCPPGANPARDALWQRAAEALVRFEGEGIPGWLTDRGRFFVLLGPPAKEEIITVQSRFGPAKGLIWTYPDAAGQPKSLAFLQVRTAWVFAGSDQADAAGKAAELNPQPIFELAANLANSWRGRSCEMTPEQRAAASKDALRTVLWETAGKVLEGQAPAIPDSWLPSWYFFPAADNATFVWLVLTLPPGFPEGARIGALLRGTENPGTGYFLGGEDFPFQTRKSGERTVAVGARAIPPGKYAVALGVADAQGEIAEHFAGEQLVVNLSSASLRLTSVILAQEIKETPQLELPGPFRLANFELIPKAGRVVRHGESLRIFYQVLGAVSGADQKTNFSVTYQLHIKPQGKNWMKAGKPQVLTNRTGANQVWELPISPQFPPTEYKVEIQIQDANGATATMEVPFEIKAA